MKYEDRLKQLTAAIKVSESEEERPEEFTLSKPVAKEAEEQEI